MRPIYLSAIVFMFCINGVVSQTKVNDPKLDEFAIFFISALQSKDINNLLALKPTPIIWRAALPEETQFLTDDQLLNQVINSEKFITDFNNIMESAKKSKINLDDLYYIGALYGENAVENKLLGISLKYEYKGKEIIFAVSLLRYNSNFYLSEILMSYDIFSRNYLGK
ncbi:MAG: hypothetical protein ISR55_03010 [Bacteroidetes bacterium]|nr:hypothetical protein [Bacteroidota bacterium]